MGRACQQFRNASANDYASRFAAVFATAQRTQHQPDPVYGHTPATRTRRLTLLSWIKERPEHNGLSAPEIVDVSGIYTGNGRYDSCFSDLKFMVKAGLLRRLGAPVARWHLP